VYGCICYVLHVHVFCNCLLTCVLFCCCHLDCTHSLPFPSPPPPSLLPAAFQYNVKFWRLFADVINDVGLTLELLSPTFPEYFLTIACIGSVCRAMCGIAAGATRVALTHHFALENNYADIASKEGMQETAVTLFGLVCGMYMANWLQGGSDTWWVFLALTVLHVYANWKAVTALILKSISRQRLEILTQQYLDDADIHDESHVSALTPTQVSQRECVFILLAH
jgi:hypothetical protein